ncbi:MAG: patatin-like phospholipase family protein [Fimbriimonadaceae bacterium]|nr:patatin-like phospholipase family protein [Alphaproteobacteria bacterium]
MTKPKIGIVPGSGAARGWSHVGVLQALAEEGIEPDVVCGSSMGALVGAAYIADELKTLEEWACSMKW